MWPHTKWNPDSELAHLSHLQDLEHWDRFADYRLYYYVSTIWKQYSHNYAEQLLTTKLKMKKKKKT